VTTVPVIIVKKINGRALSLNHLIADDIIAKVVIVSPTGRKKKNAYNAAGS
jgi:CRISPR/Cas system-associated exonuclease Cas4 (RecB family)